MTTYCLVTDQDFCALFIPGLDRTQKGWSLRTSFHLPKGLVTDLLLDLHS